MSVNEPSTVESVSSPGAQLRQAREQAGMSLEFIAERTLISLHKLRALEDDDFSAVGGRAYATGYTRAYARVVGIDAKEIVRNIEVTLGSEQPGAPIAATAAKPTKSNAGSFTSTPWFYPAIIVLLVVLLVVWGVIWLTGSEPRSADSATAPPVRSAEPVVPDASKSNTGGALNASERPDAAMSEEQPVEAPLELEINRLERPSERETADEAAGTLPPSPQEVITAEAEEDTAFAQAENEPPGADASGLESALRQNINAGVTDLGQEIPSEGQESAEGALGVADDQLQISFAEECWLEVSDATGRTLVADLARAGETREVRGVAPFRVVLGNALAATQITYNEEDVSFAPRPGRRVLRLTIGE